MNYQHNNNPSRMNKRVTFFNPPVEIVNGWPSAEWEEHAKVWAEVKTQKGFRMFNSDATQWQGKMILGIRYRNDIHEKMRIKVGNKLYEIESLTDDDERNQFYTIVANEVL